MKVNEYYKDDTLKTVVQIIEIYGSDSARCKLIQGKGTQFPPGMEVIIAKSTIDLCMQKCTEDFRYKELD